MTQVANHKNRGDISPLHGFYLAYLVAVGVKTDNDSISVDTNDTRFRYNR